MKVVEAIAEFFVEAGFKHYFGVPGGAIWAILDALIDHPELKGIVGRTEGEAVNMADVYFRSTGRVAPVIATKGPGVLNMPNAIANAMFESSAVLAIGASGPTQFFGKGGFEEVYFHQDEDTVSIFRPIVKRAWLVTRPEDTVEILQKAYKTAISGRPGPVFVQIPWDIQQDNTAPRRYHTLHRLVTSRVRADSESMKKAAQLLVSAKQPLMVAGNGVIISRAADELAQVVEKFTLPVVTSLVAKGAYPEDNKLSLGPVGRSGWDCAAQATREADVILSVGARFSDNHSGNWREGIIYNSLKSKIIHVDMDPNEIGRNYPVELGIMADAKTFFQDLIIELNSQGAKSLASPDWLAKIAGFKKQWEERVRTELPAGGSPVHPGRIVQEVNSVMPKDAMLFIDVSDVIQYAEAYAHINQPGSWFINSGMATMGWASCGALGAKAAYPDRAAIILVGDGGFNMVPYVLATAVMHNLPAVWVILNNNEFNIERKASEALFGRSHPWTKFTYPNGKPYNPDFVALAKAYGAQGEKVTDTAQVAGAVRRGLASNQPYVIDVLTDPQAKSFFTTGVTRAYPTSWREPYPFIPANQA
jgi:acetolactate synthase I/II/III large subunit